MCDERRSESESSVRKSSLEYVDSALGSEANCSTPGSEAPRGSSSVSDDEQGFQRQLELREIIRDLREEKEKHLQTALEMALKVDELQKSQCLDKADLSQARDRLRVLEEQQVRGQRSQSDQHLSDEIRAWKELVDHQKAILEKVKSELEETQTALKEKEAQVEKMKEDISRIISEDKPKAQVRDNETQTEPGSWCDWGKEMPTSAAGAAGAAGAAVNDRNKDHSDEEHVNSGLSEEDEDPPSQECRRLSNPGRAEKEGTSVSGSRALYSSSASPVRDFYLRQLFQDNSLDSSLSEPPLASSRRSGAEDGASPASEAGLTSGRRSASLGLESAAESRLSSADSGSESTSVKACVRAQHSVNCRRIKSV